MCLLDWMKCFTLDSAPFTQWSLSGESEVLYEIIAVCLSQEQLGYSTKYIIHWSWGIKTVQLITWVCQYTATLMLDWIIQSVFFLEYDVSSKYKTLRQSLLQPVIVVLLINMTRISLLRAFLTNVANDCRLIVHNVDTCDWSYML